MNMSLRNLFYLQDLRYVIKTYFYYGVNQMERFR